MTVKVGYIAGEPTAYRVPQMDLLARQDGIDLTSVYAGRSLQGHSWTIDHTHRTLTLRGVNLPTKWLLQHDYPITPSILSVLRREKFDALVIAGWSVFACQLAIIWARATRTPYLVFAENHGREPRPRWISVLRRGVLPHVLIPAAGTLATGSLSATHLASLGADPTRILRLPNTVDVPALAGRAVAARRRRDEIRRRLDIANGAFVILQVSRLVPVKAIDVTIDAVAKLSDGEITPAPVLLIVGEGPERASLEARARAAGIDARFPGFLQGDHLTEAYVASDVMTLLSRRETWGVVVNEAAACGLPIVVSWRVGASADLVRDGVNGFVVPSDDPAAAADGLAALLDPDRRRRFGEASSEIVRGWGYEAGVDALANALRSVTS